MQEKKRHYHSIDPQDIQSHAEKFEQLAKIINSKAEIKYIGIRPGEKLHECMISDSESYKTLNCKNYYIILQNVDFKKYIDNYKNDYISIREENNNYNSFNNNLIKDCELKKLIVEYIN